MTQEDLEIRRAITDEIEERSNPSTDEVIQAVSREGYDKDAVVSQMQEMETHGFLYTVGSEVKTP